ncbi:MAG: hypothetical protein Q4E51_05210 [Lachnospiraceae bacterium]|nr:hypothetical protein [Lachnospiraceae bacterium]
MTFKLLNKSEVEKIYNSHMINDFPENELKPISSIFEMMDDNSYEPLGIMEEGNLIGYAFNLILNGTNYILLDYLAIFNELRGKALGSRTLSALKKEYPDKVIFIESENPEFMEEKYVPKKRMKFYQKNGCIDTFVRSEIWGAPYINMYISNMDTSLTKSDCMSAIKGFYKYMIKNEKLYNEKVKIN